nr:P1 [Rose yellow mosaic virus]
MAPTTIGSRLCSYVESALRGLKLSFKSETEFRTFVDKHKNTFTAYKNLPNEHYYNLLEAFRNGVSYNPERLTYGCPFCSVEAANIPEALAKINSEGHQKYCSKVRETRVDIKQHKDGVVSTTTIKNDKEVGNKITDDCQNPANMIRIGDFIINTDMDAKAQGLPRIIEPTMTGDRHLLTGVVTLKELTPEPKPVAEKKKRHRKTLSQDRKEWVMKWPATDSEVTKDTFKHHFVEVQHDFGFIDLLADERDEISREESVTNTTKTWFGLRRSVTKVTPKLTVKTKVNDLIKQTLLIASELNLPIEYIDNRKHILKKRGRFYRVPLVHCYNPDIAMEDDIQDPILREILSSKYMSEQVKNFDPFLLSSKLVKPGWSGVLVHRDNVLDQHKFEWNKHGLCVIQGIGVNNYILSALEKHDDCDIMEFY